MLIKAFARLIKNLPVEHLTMTEAIQKEDTIQTTILRCRSIRDYKKSLQQMPLLHGEAVSLGPLPEDAGFCELYKKWLENESIIKGTGDDKSQYTSEQIMKMVQECNQDPGELTLCIFDKGDSSPIGDINLIDTEEFNDGPELKIMIGENRGHGRGTDAMRVLLDHAFNTIGLGTINLSVYKDNLCAFKLFKKFDFSIISEKVDSDNGREEYVMKLRYNDFIGKNSQAGIP